MPRSKQSPPITCTAPASQQHLRALVTRLRQLTESRTAQLNQRRLVHPNPAVEASFAELLAVVAAQIDAHAAEHLHADRR